MSASTKFKGDFTDRRIQEIIQNDEKNTLVTRHKRYEVQPQNKYSGEKFRLLVGTAVSPTRILKDDEKEGKDFPYGAHVELVPIEFYSEFLRNPERYLREVCGISSGAISPFIPQRHKVTQAVDSFKEKELKNPGGFFATVLKKL